MLVVLAPLLLASLIQGCLDINTTTRVHPDGSLTRSVEISGDSSEVALGCRLMGIDSSWAQMTDTAANHKPALTATKQFRSYEEANKTLAGVPLKKIDIVLKLEKRFRWFTTIYRYEETWKRVYTFDHVPLSNYLSTWEIDMFRSRMGRQDSIKTPGDKQAMEAAAKRAEKWVVRNFFEEYFSRVVDGVEMLNDPSLPVDSVLHAKPGIFAQAEELFEGDKWMANDSVQLVFVRELKNPAIRKAFEVNAASLAEFKKFIKFVQDAGSPEYKVNAVVPGLITDTNAGSVEGNKVRWVNFKEPVLYAEDYTMWVESRVVNWWMIMGTGLVVIAIGLMMVLGLVRNRRPGMVAA